jgi:hypothetical protein
MQLIEGWNAWINRQPGPGSTPTLYVTGKFEVPTGGYSMELSKSEQQEDGNVLRLELNVSSPGPDDIVTQAVEQKDVRYEEQTDIAYKKVQIMRPDEVDVTVAE